MTIETLKKLILAVIPKSDLETIDSVDFMFDLYEKDNIIPPTNISPNYVYDYHTTNFYDTCSCNPKNGGSGVCNCTMSGIPLTC